MCTHCEVEQMAAKPAKPAKRKAKAPKRTTRKGPRITHEQYVASMVNVLLKQPGVTAEDRKAIELAKITYGGGEMGVRGITWFDKWQHGTGAKAPKGHFVGINATWQKTVIELAETVAHELGHVTAGKGTGHGPEWSAACARLGFVHARATDDGKPLDWSWFTPECAKALKALPLPTDGSPLAPAEGGLGPWGKPILKPVARPCGAGWGVRGGKSRGTGSKSRLLLWECKCEVNLSGKPGPIKLRCASTELDVTCNKCKRKFHLVEESLPPAHTNGGPILTKKRQRELDEKSGKVYRVKRPRPGKKKAAANAKGVSAKRDFGPNPTGELPPGL